MGCRLNSYRCRLSDETTFAKKLMSESAAQEKDPSGLGDTSSSRELIYFRKRSLGPPLRPPVTAPGSGGL